MKSAARSPIMMLGALVLPETSRGMIEAFQKVYGATELVAELRK